MFKFKNIIIIIIKNTISLLICIGLRFIKSILLFNPIGFMDLIEWRINKWIIIIINKINGIKKWIEKNRLIKILSILKLPHNHSTILFPITGIDDRKFVITIIAQYDIWFQIKEYPIKDSIIIINIIIRPEIHIGLLK